MKHKKVIALITDFGQVDAYVASIKGAILSISPYVSLVDIVHLIEPQNVDEAAYVLWTTFKYFPKETIFICVVDPGVGTSRKIICVQGDGYIFLAPDNGILKYILGTVRKPIIISVENSEYFRSNISNTFNGRDIFAPVAAHIANGLNIRKLGPRTTPLSHPEYFIECYGDKDQEYEGKIIHIDNFGNVITNLLLKSGNLKSFRLKIGKSIINNHSISYTGGSTHMPFIINGSSGLLEVSVRNNSAAKILKSKVHDKVLLST